MQARRPELLLEQRIDEGAGILVVDDRDDELHARSIGARERPAADAGRTAGTVAGGVYDAARPTAVRAGVHA